MGNALVFTSSFLLTAALAVLLSPFKGLTLNENTIRLKEDNLFAINRTNLLIS